MRSQTQTINVGLASQQLLPANPKRICLTFTNLGPDDVFLALGQPAAATAGHVIHAGERPVRFSAYDFGDNITSPLFAIAATAASKLTVTEAFT